MSTKPYSEPDYAQIKAEARRLYETGTGSFASVAADVGISERTIKKWSRDDGYWEKQSAPVSAVDKLRRLAAIADDLEPAHSQEARNEAKAQARNAIATTESMTPQPVPEDATAKLIDKHQRQWRVVDALAAESVRGRDEKAARLAFALARTFATAQRSERIAYGLGSGDTPTTTVVIERETPGGHI